MVGRKGEEPGIFKRSGHFFRVAAFHRSLHQIPVAAVTLEKKNPRAIGHDPAPFIDSTGVGDARHALHAWTRDTNASGIDEWGGIVSTGVGDARHALHAWTRDGIDDEKEQPGTKSNRAGKK